MQQFRIILLLVFAFSIAFFAIINHEPIEINFFYLSELSISKALLMLICISLGSLGTMAALLPSILRRRRAEKAAKKEKIHVEKELISVKQEKEEVINKVHELENIKKVAPEENKDNSKEDDTSGNQKT